MKDEEMWALAEIVVTVWFREVGKILACGVGLGLLAAGVLFLIV